MKKLLCIAAIAILAAAFTAPAAQAQASENLLIKGGTVYDGSGNAPVKADVLVKGNTILAIGDASTWKGKIAKAAKKASVIDATGMAVTPGFIDPHSHVNSGLAKEKTKNGTGYLRMGVTSVLCGVCGGSPVPLSSQADKLTAQGAGLNVGYFIGLGAVRRKVMGKADREPTAAELETMKGYVRDAMEWGAFGCSSGLIYVPGIFSKTPEIIALTKEIAPFKGIYTTHMRNEGEGVCKALDEAIEICREANVDLNVSHIKCAGPKAHGMSSDVIAKIEEAQASGMHVTADQYTYAASSTSLKATLLPKWAVAASKEKLNKMFDDPETLAKIKKHIQGRLEVSNNGANLYIPTKHKNVEEIAKDMGLEPVDAVIELFRKGSPAVVNHSMSEADVCNFMKQPWVMTCTDGNTGSGHPRNRGSFARKIRKYVNEDHLITLDEAIRRCTGLVADTYGIAKRGYLKEGYYADITIFDPVNVRDNATFDKPAPYATGFKAVIVNGRIAVLDDNVTGVLAGEILKMDNKYKVR